MHRRTLSSILFLAGFPALAGAQLLQADEVCLKLKPSKGEHEWRIKLIVDPSTLVIQEKDSSIQGICSGASWVVKGSLGPNPKDLLDLEATRSNRGRNCPNMLTMSGRRSEDNMRIEGTFHFDLEGEDPFTVDLIPCT